jgi:hypothetical protein
MRRSKKVVLTSIMAICVIGACWSKRTHLFAQSAEPGSKSPEVERSVTLAPNSEKSEPASYSTKTAFTELPAISAHRIIRLLNRLSGPLFLHHPESESPAVCVLVNSRLAANSQAISCGVLSP